MVGSASPQRVGDGRQVADSAPVGQDLLVDELLSETRVAGVVGPVRSKMAGEGKPSEQDLFGGSCGKVLADPVCLERQSQLINGGWR